MLSNVIVLNDCSFSVSPRITKRSNLLWIACILLLLAWESLPYECITRTNWLVLLRTDRLFFLLVLVPCCYRFLFWINDKEAWNGVQVFWIIFTWSRNETFLGFARVEFTTKNWLGCSVF